MHAYGSAPDDLADAGLAPPPKVNTAYGSAPDDLEDHELVLPPKINTAYGSLPDDYEIKKPPRFGGSIARTQTIAHICVGLLFLCMSPLSVCAGFTVQRFDRAVPDVLFDMRDRVFLVVLQNVPSAVRSQTFLIVVAFGHQRADQLLCHNKPRCCFCLAAFAARPFLFYYESTITRNRRGCGPEKSSWYIDVVLDNT